MRDTTKRLESIKDDLKEIKQWLIRGEIKEVADECGISVKYAYHILAGRGNNPRFLNKARERAIKNKTEQVKSIKKLKSITA